MSTGHVTLITPAPIAPSGNPALVYIASLGSESSRRTAIASLRTAARLLTDSSAPDPLALDWTGLRYGHMTALRTRLAETYAPATCNRVLSVVRSVLRTAYRLGAMDGEDYRRAAEVESVAGERLPAGRYVESDELARLVGVCKADPTPAGARDAAVLALLFQCGMRRSEVCAALVTDIDQVSGRVHVQRGKGNKARLVYLTGGALHAVRAWVGVRGDAPGALITRIGKGGRLTTDGISVTALYDIVVKRAADAGLIATSPHDLRRTFVTAMLDVGADVLAVKRIAGHSSTNTTERYDRSADRRAEAAAGMIDFPY